MLFICLISLSFSAAHLKNSETSLNNTSLPQNRSLIRAQRPIVKIMSQFCMPFLIVNYGAEMIFILDQRLQAQAVAPEKAAKVLHDVVKAMFAPTFVEELMRPQGLYTPAQTKEIFDRLAHSSIMRLSENSMDKLYDLMTMGCKYQYVTLRNPFELVELTLNHLDNIRASLNATKSETLDDITTRMQTLCASLTCGTLADIRHQLLNFFQGKRVKVSLFLQEGMQNTDATLNIPADTHLSPLASCEAPGLIRYCENGAVALQETFPHPDSALAYRIPPESYSPFIPSTRQCTQGKNLYLTDRKKKDAAAVNTPTAAPSASAAPSSTSAALVSGATAAGKPTSGSKPSTTNVGALNSLSSLIIGGQTSGQFKLNLFDDPHDDDAAGAAPTSLDVAPVINISKMSKEEVRLNNPELFGVVGSFQVSQATKPPPSGGDDLLDLMDSA